ncbi:MAG TPA: hypothetical protein VLG27_02190 [Candidatus Saccharimonadia bacterium]|nr:hypothetical protein [Candidatus Saccharimonadia bacterium]
MTKTAYQINEPVETINQRRYKRRKRVAAAAFGIFGLVIIAVLLDLHHLNAAGSQPIGKTLHSTIAGPQTFKNAYFEFSDSAKWQYAANDSTTNKLTYLLYVNGVPAHMLTVYVNQTPLQSDLATTRVIPVQIVDGNSLVPAGDISPACGTLYKPTDLKRIKPVALAGTSLLCVPDSPQFTVVVGRVGGDYNLILTRSGGLQARYIIIYHNLSVDPDSSPFTRIMKTFKAV